MQAKLSSFAFTSSVQVEFIRQDAANAITSRNRPISVSPDVLAVINAFCNEFIFLSTSACTTSDNDIPSTPTAALSVGATLAVPFTTECYKSRGLLRVLPNVLGKNCVLEAELALRQLLRSSAGKSALKNDAALLRKDSLAPSTQSETGKINVKSAWAELRLFCGELLQNSADLADGSSELSRWAIVETKLKSVQYFHDLQNTVLENLQSSPDTHQTSLNLTPALAIYVSTALGYLVEQILLFVARVVERDSRIEEAGLRHLYEAAKENDSFWDFFEGTRTKSILEKEVAQLSRRQSITRGGPRRQPSIRRADTTTTSVSTAFSLDLSSSIPDSSTPQSGKFRKSIDSQATRSTAHSSLAIPTGSQSDEYSDDEDAAGDFDQLMHSGQTLKFSITPDRLISTMNPNSATKRSNGQGKPDRGIDMSPPPFSKLAAQAPKTPRAGTRLTARSGIKEEPEEDLSDSDEDLFTGRKKPKKESLKDLLDSEPPWASDPAPMPVKLASITNTKNGTAHARNQDSVGSSDTMTSSALYPTDSYASATPASVKRRGPKLQPKDETARPAPSRDLIDFFNQEPPQSGFTSTTISSDPPLRKKSSSRFRNLMGKLTPSKDEAENYNPNESLGRTSMQHAAPSRNLQHSASHKSMHSMSSSHDFSGPPRRQTVSTVTAPVPSVPKVFDGGAMPSLPTPKARKTSVEHPRAAPDSSLLLPAEHRKSSQSGHASERSGSSADEDKYSAPSTRKGSLSPITAPSTAAQTLQAAIPLPYATKANNTSPSQAINSNSDTPHISRDLSKPSEPEEKPSLPPTQSIPIIRTSRSSTSREETTPDRRRTVKRVPVANSDGPPKESTSAKTLPRRAYASSSTRGTAPAPAPSPTEEASMLDLQSTSNRPDPISVPARTTSLKASSPSLGGDSIPDRQSVLSDTPTPPSMPARDVTQILMALRARLETAQDVLECLREVDDALSRHKETDCEETAVPAESTNDQTDEALLVGYLLGDCDEGIPTDSPVPSLELDTASGDSGSEEDVASPADFAGDTSFEETGCLPQMDRMLVGKAPSIRQQGPHLTSMEHHRARFGLGVQGLQGVA